MATLNLWAGFSKRRNSTRQPSGSADAAKTVRLKEGTSLQQPTFILDGQMHGYNYAQFAGMYYYIDDVVIAKNNITELNCSLDRLATYKAAIQASSAYVQYYDHINSEIADRRLSVKSTQVTQKNTGTFGFLGKASCYVLTVIGKDSTESFVLTASQIAGLYAQDYQTVFDASINAISPVVGSTPADAIIDLVRWWSDFLKSAAGSYNYAGSISENIKSCMILPVAAGAIGGTPNVDLYIGAVDTLIDGFKMTDRVFTDTATVTIPWQASDWRRLEPYHEIYLYIPAVGLIRLSTSDLIGETSLTVNVTMDTLSGDAIFEVLTATKCVYYCTTNLGTPYALGSSQTSGLKAANALIGAAGIISGNPAAVIGGSISLANSLQPTPTCIGSNAGGAILGIDADKIYCISVFHDTTVAPSSVSAVKGTPYNGVMSLSGISGYVQTSGAAVDMAGLGNDKDIVNNYLDGGIYIE